MYPTIIRYDSCYTTLFKCCRKRIGDYPHLSAWLADVHQLTVKKSPNLQVATPSPCLCGSSAGCQIEYIPAWSSNSEDCSAVLATAAIPAGYAAGQVTIMIWSAKVLGSVIFGLQLTKGQQAKADVEFPWSLGKA